MYKTKRFLNTTLELRFNNIFAMISLLLTFKSFLILLIHGTRNFLKFWPSLYYIACQSSFNILPISTEVLSYRMTKGRFLTVSVVGLFLLNNRSDCEYCLIC